MSTDIDYLLGVDVWAVEDALKRRTKLTSLDLMTHRHGKTPSEYRAWLCERYNAALGKDGAE